MANVTRRIYYFAYRGTTGLSDVTIDIYNPSNTKVVDGASLSEIGDGLYYYDFTTSTDGWHVAKIDSASQPRLDVQNFKIETATTNTTSSSTSSIHYVSTADVYRTSGLTSSEVSTANVLEFIKEAEEFVDRYCNTVHWHEADSGTGTSASTVTFTDNTKSWADDEYINSYLWIYSGTGKGQVRKIDDNDSNNITVATAFTSTPDSTSKYRLIHCGKDPYNHILDVGDDESDYFLNKYPAIAFEEVISGGTTIQTSNIYRYDKIGKLVLKSTAERSYWSSEEQGVNIKYYYGVYPLPYEVKRLTMVIAAINSLVYQIGGTFDDVTSYSIPDFQASKGEPYTNIRETVLRLTNEANRLMESVVRYRSIY